MLLLQQFNKANINLVSSNLKSLTPSLINNKKDACCEKHDLKALKFVVMETVPYMAINKNVYTDLSLS